MNTHTLEIVNRAGKTRVLKTIRAQGFNVSHGRFFTCPTDALPLDLLKSGALKDTCPEHHPARKVRGEKRALPSATLLQFHKQREQERARGHDLVDSLLRANYRQARALLARRRARLVVHYANTPVPRGYELTMRGGNIVLSVTLQPGWYKEIASVPGLADAGGMLTTHARKIADNMWAASWIYGHRYVHTSRSGVILRTPGGSWIHAKTARGARMIATRRDPAHISELARERASRTQYVKSLSREQIVALYPDVPVSLADSVAAGNCKSGTREWAERFFPGRTRVTVAEVLAVDDDDHRNAILRAVRAALVRARVTPPAHQHAA